MEEIKIENLSFCYPEREKAALSEVSLKINSGEFVLICGKSGCGKTTFLRMLKPSLSPHGKMAGKITLLGKDINDISQREQAEKIGFVFQNPDTQTVCDKVWHELAFGLENLGAKPDEIRARVAEMAAFFGIEDLFYKNVCELSGGQKQLLNLASVMTLNPKILILDEPTAMLDPISAREFFDILSKINKETGTTVIISEHHLGDALAEADRAVVFEDGRIIADDSPKKIGSLIKNNDMFFSLPTPMRVFLTAEDDIKECPVTVRDGKKWLSGKKMNKDIEFKTENKTAEKTVLQAKEIRFRYERDSGDILKDFSMNLNQGEMYALVGGNGGGKSTALSVIAGVLKPVSGKIKNMGDGKIALLTQNPKNLFSEETVLKELQKAAVNGGGNSGEIETIANLCEITDLLESHPYDLSGGEQQRVALGIILLTNPDILALDEPTKGLDSAFKEKLAKIIGELKNKGKTVLIVSHDLEFCAKHADRVGMLFDGKIVSEDEPRGFFSDKSFYTTAANRMAGDMLKGAITDGDILSALGKTEKTPNISDVDTPFKEITKEEECKEKCQGIQARKIIFSCVFGILFILSMYAYFVTKAYGTQILSIIFLGASINELVRQNEICVASRPKRKRKISVSSVLVFPITAATVAIGYFLGRTSYYPVMLLVLAEVFVFAALSLERRKPKAREIVAISVLCALAVAGRVAFSSIPQFKASAAVVIISGICFGGETGFLVGAVCAVVSNMFFGQGPWTPWQMIAFGSVGFLGGVVFGGKRITRLKVSIFGFLAVVIIYGGIMNLNSALMMGGELSPASLSAVYAAGFPFDFIHGLSTAIFLWIATEEMCKRMERIKIKYGLV